MRQRKAMVKTAHGPTDLRGATCLVTGAGGFIGSHLAEALVAAGAKTRCFVHYNATGRRGWLDSSPYAADMEFVSGDIADRDSVRSAMAGTDVVFHLAALIAIPYSYVAPESYVRTNIVGTLNVLQAARESKTSRVVHTSTSEVYGSARFVPITEEHPLTGQSPYSASKIGADALVESFYRSFDLPVVTVRPFNTFGPRQSMRAVIPTIAAQCLSGAQVQLGNLAATRDFNYVENTVAGFLAAGVKPVIGQTINLGTGREISVGDLAELIARIAGRAVRVVGDDRRVRPAKSEVDRLLADSTRAHTQLAWEPRVSLEEGLERTIPWVAANLAHYRPADYAI